MDNTVKDDVGYQVSAEGKGFLFEEVVFEEEEWEAVIDRIEEYMKETGWLPRPLSPTSPAPGRRPREIRGLKK